MKIVSTISGRAVARSGLLPSTAHQLLGYISSAADVLLALSQKCAQATDATSDDFAYVMIAAALASPEYIGQERRRFYPYQLATNFLTGPYDRVGRLLLEQRDPHPINGATLATRWIGGTPMRTIEDVLDIRSGVLTSMFAEVSSILRGLADIMYAATAAQDVHLLPTAVDQQKRFALAQLVGPVRRIGQRLDSGLPEDCLWLDSVQDGAGQVVTRKDIMGLRGAGFVSPDRILDTGMFPALFAALGTSQAAAVAHAQRLQAAVRSWRLAERERLFEGQLRRLPAECRGLLKRYYRSLGTDFERALEEALECLGIHISARDDGTRSSFPDLVTADLGPGEVALECKSKTVGDAVTFNDATEVIRKASVNGLSAAFKVTVCQPYISPDVPRKLDLCTELSVVNAEDLAEALVRVRIGKLTVAELSDWLRRPGQAIREQLPTTPIVAAV